MFVILFVINFASILAIYYLYYTKVANPDLHESLKTNSLKQSATANSKPTNIIAINTKYGQLVGQKHKFQSKDVATFLGVPFAKPPIGNLRFKPPNEPNTWNGTKFEAFEWPNPCVQPDNRLRLQNSNFSEDCLYINIWAPWHKSKSTQKKPVIVLIHTGAFIFGSASEATYNGIALSSIGNVIVVTFNYRLNFYGYFYSGNSEQAAPNLGMLDQVAALKWTKENIANFNGDPERITLVGQSSGGLSVGMHITSPLSRGLFSQAIIMSGSPLQTTTLNKPTEVIQFWLNYARHIKCDKSELQTAISNDTFECIKRTVSTNRNLLPSMSLVKKLSSDSLFVNLPIVEEGDFQPKSQVELLLSEENSNLYKNFSLLIGYTNDEGSWIASMEDNTKFGPNTLPSISSNEAMELIKIYLGKMKTTKDTINVTDIVDYYLKHLYDIQDIDPKHDALILSRLVSSVLGDHYITCPVNLFTNLLLNYQASIYQYYWTYKGNPRTSAFWNTFSKVWCGQWMGSCHSFEMFALFGAPFIEPAAFNAEDRVVSMKTIRMVSHMAHNRTLFWPKFVPSRSTTNNDYSKMYYIMDSLADQFKFGSNLKTNVCDNIWGKYLI